MQRDTSALAVGVGAIIVTLVTLWMSTAFSQTALWHAKRATEADVLVKVNQALPANDTVEKKMRFFGWMEIMIAGGTIRLDACKEVFGDRIAALTAYNAVGDVDPLRDAADNTVLWQNFANLLARVTQLEKGTTVSKFLLTGEGMVPNAKYRPRWRARTACLAHHLKAAPKKQQCRWKI